MYPNLKLLLWRTGLRQNRLAQKLNMDETLLSRIVNGFRQPSDELKVRIAEVLHSDIEWLFEAAHDGEQQRTSGQTGK
jgi:transcriptional regulator with XRE-family HTH domain